MAAEPSALLIGATGATASFLVAAATGLEAVDSARQAVQSAQEIARMSDGVIILVCAGGGFMGATTALGFKFLKGTWRDKGIMVVSSAMLATWGAPYFMEWRGIQMRIIPALFVSGAIGLLAHVIVPLVIELVPQWARAWAKKADPSADDKP